MKDHIYFLGILRILAITSAFIISLYVFYMRAKWLRFSQALKPLLLGLLLLMIVIIVGYLRWNGFDINKLSRLLILHDPAQFGLSRLIALAYIVILSGIEILLIVSVKVIKMKKKIK